ncbi:VOC family protein [Alicyclobacillus sp.]|uniref:VOC family protein n=1 Tax=Alicyclobacillus sp. TaxID=61169 RepID=UPI0025BBCC41|nr:VOC family protein [Alicyclobacillus sp.]MCL6517670.1 VOC family protein [Alicyclobacillus sp.]
MDLRFDHLIHAVKDPDRVRREFAEAFGWHTVAGGEHPGFGTHNALAYFGLPYIEWVGVRDEAVAARRPFGRDVLRAVRAGGGPLQFAVRTRDIEGLARRWRAAGLVHEGPVEASRVRPDGVVLRWRMLFPEQVPGRLLLPFVIEWPQDDEQRLEGLRRDELVLDGPGQPALRQLHLVTADLADYRRRLEAYFPGAAIERESTMAGSALRWPCHGVTVWVWEKGPGLCAVGVKAQEAPFLAVFSHHAARGSERGPEDPAALFAGACSPMHGLRVVMTE